MTAPASTPQPGQALPAPLLVHNLLNDITAIGPLLLDEVRRGSWLHAYLLAVGINQIVEDYLHPDPYLLGKAGEYLDRMPRPLGVAAAGAVRSVDAALARIRQRRASLRYLLCRQEDLAALVRQLADAVVCPSTVSPAMKEAMQASSGELVGALSRCSPGLSREVLRLPSCFRSFDQQPADLDRIARDFARRWPDRRTPLVVVGVRTSGSYLAPLYAAFLKRYGYVDIGVLTVRPGRRLLPREGARLRAAARRGGLALLADDPPSSAASLARAARALEGAGVPPRSIILLLQLFGSRDALPPRLKRYAAVTLPWDEWAIHEQLTPASVRSTLDDLVAPYSAVRAVERLPLPFRTTPRDHARALYRAQLVDLSTGRHREQCVFVTGTGLGYFGEHALAVARALPRFSPDIYGFRAGLLYRRWLPEAHRVPPTAPGTGDTVAAAMVSYVLTRRRALAVDEDVSLRLGGRLPVWEAASNLMSQVFGRGWMLARIPAVDPLVKRLLRCARPAVVDGSMTPSHWFVDGTGARHDGTGEMHGERLLKVDAAERAFSHWDLYCYDAVFDLASLAASVDLAGLATGTQEQTLGQRLRDIYEEATAEPIGAERWLLYQLVHLWDHQRAHDDARPRVRRASARALQRYFAETMFKGLAARTRGPLCAIDVDGVLETNALRFPGLTPAGAVALRALTLHGYRPVLVTGRSLDEVRERCAAYHLAGGVAEYGAVIYDHGTGGVRELLSDDDRAILARLRVALGAIEGVYLDPDYRHAVRAYRLDEGGHRRGLGPEVIALALAECGGGRFIRPISGEGQTDFMVAGIDKGTGLRALIDELGMDGWGADGKPLALAVGDSMSDLPMFELAALALAPANADAGVRSVGVRILKRPYQSGLALATAQLLGHRPGSCPVCSPPRLSSDTRRLFALLAAQEAGTWGIARAALLLATKEWTAALRSAA